MQLNNCIENLNYTLIKKFRPDEKITEKIQIKKKIQIIKNYKNKYHMQVTLKKVNLFFKLDMISSFIQR